MEFVGTINREQCWLSALILLLCVSGCTCLSPQRSPSRNRVGEVRSPPKNRVGEVRSPPKNRVGEVRSPPKNRDGEVGDGQCKLPTAQRYPGLFVSNAKITRVSYDSSALFSDTYKISKVLMRIPVNISTGGDSTTARPGFRITGDPCCATTMTMTVPSTVTPKYNNQMEYTVKHLASSFQIIHESKCVSPGASCTLSGTCKLSYRVQWVLVETYDGYDQFIPVEIGNHCYCQYR